MALLVRCTNLLATSVLLYSFVQKRRQHSAQHHTVAGLQFLTSTHCLMSNFLFLISKGFSMYFCTTNWVGLFMVLSRMSDSLVKHFIPRPRERSTFRKRLRIGLIIQMLPLPFKRHCGSTRSSIRSTFEHCSGRAFLLGSDFLMSLLTSSEGVFAAVSTCHSSGEHTAYCLHAYITKRSTILSLTRCSGVSLRSVTNKATLTLYSMLWYWVGQAMQRFRIDQQQVHLQFSTKFSSSDRSDRSQHLGQNSNTSMLWLYIMDRSDRQSPALVVRQPLLEKWLITCSYYRNWQSMSFVLAVHLKSNRRDLVSGFSTHPRSSKALRKSLYLPLMMKILLLACAFFLNSAIKACLDGLFYSREELLSDDRLRDLFFFIAYFRWHLQPIDFNISARLGQYFSLGRHLPLSRACLSNLSQFLQSQRFGISEFITFKLPDYSCLRKSSLSQHAAMTPTGQYRQQLSNRSHSPMPSMLVSASLKR